MRRPRGTRGQKENQGCFKRKEKYLCELRTREVGSGQRGEETGNHR